MKIFEQIIEELIELVEKKKIHYSYNVNEDECAFEFSNKRISIRNFFNRDQNSYYYNLVLSNREPGFEDYEIVVDYKNNMFNRINYLCKFVEEEHYESDEYLQKILAELKAGEFEKEKNDIKKFKDRKTDNLPF